MPNNSQEQLSALQASKSKLREHYRKLREDISTEDSRLYSAELSQNIIKLLKDNSNWKSIAAYRSLPAEASMDVASQYAMDEGIQVLFPKVKSDREMSFHAVSDLKDDFYAGAFGISEPKSTEEVSAENIDCVFIPALAYDKLGNRLGQGKAYYDCFLQKTTACKVGVAFEAQIHPEELPTEEHDQAMDFLLTEKTVLNLKRES